VEITEIRVKLVNVKNDKLRAFCSITVDNDFVIRDLKVIEGTKGAFVAMPSRKLTDRCRCGGKNHYRARYCNDCGARLSGERNPKFEKGNQKLHTDIAHPINSRCREVIQKKVLEVYQVEMEKSQSPDYKPMDFDVFDEEALVEESSIEMGESRGGAETVGIAHDANRSDGQEVESEISPHLPDSTMTESGTGTGTGQRGPELPGPQRDGGYRPDGGRDRGRQEDRKSGHGPRDQGQGRGRFRRGGGSGGGGSGGGRTREERDQGRGDHRRGNGHGTERGGDRRPGQSREAGRGREGGMGREAGSPGGGRPEHDRDRYLPSQAPASAGPAPAPVQPPPASRPRADQDPEPEDNFGAGLFS
jgi:stage V sporulation protein G